MTPKRTDTKQPSADSDNRIEVLLLGTYHMDNPGLDVFNIEADDILAANRQQELSDLTDVLQDWQPDIVAVERPAERHDELNDLYRKYRLGELSYDEEVEIDPIHPQRDSPVSECRSEVIQVGFRLADRLGHKSISAVDYPMTLAADFDEDELTEIDDFGRMQKRARTVTDVELTNPQQKQHEIKTHLTESTVIEHLRFLNRKEQLGFNHELQFAGSLAGAEQRYVGSRMLSAWYERNIRIVENIWGATNDETDHVLLLIGSGHVNVLKHLLAEAPMFRPQSALTVLDNDS